MINSAAVIYVIGISVNLSITNVIKDLELKVINSLFENMMYNKIIVLENSDKVSQILELAYKFLDMFNNSKETVNISKSE